MKKYLFALMILSIIAGYTAKAQTSDYYTDRTSIVSCNYEYKVALVGANGISNYFRLSNVNNTKFRTTQYLPNGEPAPIAQLHYAAEFIDKTQVIYAFKEVFNSDEINKFKAHSGLDLSIVYIVAVSGDVIEVEFSFPNHPVLKSIHPDKFHLLEEKIKEKVKFRVEERFHFLGYIQGRSSRIEFDKL